MQIEILMWISYFQVLENFLHGILNVRQFILVWNFLKFLQWNLFLGMGKENA